MCGIEGSTASAPWVGYGMPIACSISSLPEELNSPTSHLPVALLVIIT